MKRCAGALVALLVLVTGCSGSDEPEPAATPTASVTRTPEKPPAPPKNGACHRLSFDEVLEPTVDGSPVACAKPHTSITIKVGQLRTAFGGHLLAVDAARVRRQPVRACADAFISYVGGSVEDRRLSMLSVTDFSPTVAASDRGEDWFRCDVIAVVSPEELGQVPASLKGILDAPAGRDQFGMCGTDRPGAADFERVVCSRPHSWQALATVDVPSGPKGKWPGKVAAEAAGQQRCAEVARTRADDALNYQWGYEWPSQSQWRAGREHGICWAPA